VTEERSVRIAAPISHQKSDDEEVDDLLLLVMNDAAPRTEPVQYAPPVQPTQPVQPSGQGVSPVSGTAAGQVMGQQRPTATKLIERGDFILFGETQPNPQNPQQVALRLLFFGTGKTDLTGFRTEFQMQPGWRLNPQAPDGIILRAKGGPPISQILFLLNETNARFALQIRVSFMFGSQPMTETVILNALP
jgi:hypothetical protein